MARILLVLLFGLTSGCASMNPELAPPSARSRTYTEKTTLKKAEAFTKAHKWVARSFGDANHVVKLADKDDGTIIVKGNVSCGVLKLGSGFAQGEYVDFTLEIAAKDKEVSATFSSVVAMSSPVAYDAGRRPANQVEADKVFTECIEPTKSELFASLK